MVAVAYIGIDYVRHLSPSWHEEVIQPVLWVVLAITAVTRVPSYKHWSAELRYSLVFIASLVFMLSTLLFEMISVRSVTAVLGLNWHKYVLFFFLIPTLITLLDITWILSLLFTFFFYFFFLLKKCIKLHIFYHCMYVFFFHD